MICASPLVVIQFGILDWPVLQAESNMNSGQVDIFWPEPNSSLNCQHNPTKNQVGFHVRVNPTCTPVIISICTLVSTIVIVIIIIIMTNSIQVRVGLAIVVKFDSDRSWALDLDKQGHEVSKSV